MGTFNVELETAHTVVVYPAHLNLDYFTNVWIYQYPWKFTSSANSEIKDYSIRSIELNHVLGVF